ECPREAVANNQPVEELVDDTSLATLTEWFEALNELLDAENDLLALGTDRIDVVSAAELVARQEDIRWWRSPISLRTSSSSLPRGSRFDARPEHQVGLDERHRLVARRRFHTRDRHHAC